jgi:D-threo-aldose 1-dehydrogenase
MLAKAPSAYPRYMYSDASMELLERARKLETLCSSYGVPLAAAALQFSLRDQRITSTIVGMSRPERLTETIALAQYPVPSELCKELESV